MTDSLVVADEAPGDWDARVVDRPGGHVYQSRAWAEHRLSSGWRPVFLSSAASAVLALTRPWPILGGGSAYLPRGPVPGGDGAVTAATLTAAAGELAAHGLDVVAADPEVPATDEAFRSAIHRAGFRPIDEIQPSRHRVTLPLGEGTDEATAFGAISKSTRQRIRKAEPSLRIVRFDARVAPDGAGEGFVSAADDAAPALDRFYGLLRETGDRRGFGFGPRREFVGWWRRALRAGHLVYLEARAADADQVVAGLIMYRHGGRLSTVHSGDHASTRREHPGALHLLRWRAIQLAVREGCAEMDLGGVDVPGARREPREGEPMYGLYQHKLSFGGRWLELTGAHELVVRPRRYATGRVVDGVIRRVSRAAGRR